MRKGMLIPVEMFIMLIFLSNIATWADTYTFQQDAVGQQGGAAYAGAKDITIDHLSAPITAEGLLRIQYDDLTLEDEAHNALIRFDGLDTAMNGRVVESASITLTFQTDYPAWGDATIDYHAVRQDWIDPDYENNDPNWILYSLTDSWEIPGAQGLDDRGYIDSLFMGDRNPPFGQYHDDYTFSLPPKLVQNWIDYPQSNYGIIITMDPEAATSVTFAGSAHDTVADRPLLTVEMIDCTAAIPADIVSEAGRYHCDCQVNMQDWSIIVQNWAVQEYSPADIAPLGAPDGIVDIEDFALFAAYWLDCTAASGCN